MNAVVFCGPSVRAEDLAVYHGFEFKPPVRQGEFHAAARRNPRAIGIIDGYFDGQAAVLHKEILWALARGITVFGASSMGALRAAELHSFGMRGVGRIFEAYRDGELTDDDEVALIHGPRETGYIRLSEPMVNIRATLEKAVAERIVDEATKERLSAGAKARFYQLRTWRGLLEDIGDPEQMQILCQWLRTGKVDRKRDDALELLNQMAAFMLSDAKPEPPAFHFEWTESWHNVYWRSQTPTSDDASAVEEEAILDEIRLRGDYSQLRRDALLRLLAQNDGDVAPDRQAVRRAAGQFRTRRGLSRQTDVIRWARENGTDLAGVELILEDNARIEVLARDRDVALRQGMLDRLRELDLYGGYREQARAKLRRAPAPAPIPRALLAAWHFEKRLGQTVPEDLADYAASIGLASVDKFYELLLRDYTFTTHAR